MEHLLLIISGLHRRDLILIGLEHFQLLGNLLHTPAGNVFQILLLLFKKLYLLLGLLLPLQPVSGAL